MSDRVELNSGKSGTNSGWGTFDWMSVGNQLTLELGNIRNPWGMIRPKNWGIIWPWSSLTWGIVATLDTPTPIGFVLAKLPQNVDSTEDSLNSLIFLLSVRYNL